MSLLDRISGLANKAKENVVSKTFISKDKRLEKSISENIKVNDIYFEKMSTYGIVSTINVVAFDCVAGLLAVAGDSNHDEIKIFGKGISTKIKLPKSVGIKYLQFKTGHPILIVIDKENNIITIDLRTKSIRHVLPAQAIITSQVYCTGTDWLFIGYANGFIDVFDVMQGVITPYQIPDLLESQEDAPESHLVVDLQMHPIELNTLLIGYECTVFIWNIRESTIRHSYSLRKLDKASCFRNANLTCLAWSPNGSRFIGGYDDGCIHIWEVKNEHKPLSSRKLSESFLPPTEHQQSTTDPIYQVAWYANDVARKSYVVVAGGRNPDDIQGLNVLEFDLESEAREAKKQTIMPLPTDLSHFLILSTNPYYSGMSNPFGIAVVGIDHCLRAYSLEHGFPSLKLPPALEFLGPNVLNACHIPQLPSPAFKKLTGITLNDQKTRYLPITGGVAGPEHVYHVDVNDLLLTIHQGELIKCWDASYTALRPLPHLTIHCLDDLDNKDAFLYCLDLNKNNGALAVGFSDGSVLVYEYHGDPEEKYAADPRLLPRNQVFIDQCDDTLKEISGLLEDMGTISDEDVAIKEEHPSNNPFIPNPPPPQENSPDSTNPFDSPSPTHQQQSKQETHEEESTSECPTPQLPPRNQSQPSIFKKINKTGDAAGFYTSLKISLDSPIKNVVSLGESLLAVASDDGKLHVFDIHRQLLLFSHNISQSDFQNTMIAPVVHTKSDIAADLQEADPNKDEQKKPASIASLNFFHTYSPSKVMLVTTHLFVGLSNGHVYRFSLTLLEKGITIPSEGLNEYLSFRATSSPLVDLLVIDLKGKSQTALTEEYLSSPIKTTEEELSSSSTTTAASLTKEISTHSTDSNVATSVEDGTSPKPSSIVSTNTSSTISSTNITSKRMAAIGKAEYRHQENPHLIICISSNSINVVLSGYNVKLFSKEVAKDSKIVRGEIVEAHGGVCLCLLLNTGKLAFYALPNLEFMLEMGLPGHCLLDRLQEASISRDGRVMFWTGKYEMEQYSFTHRPERAIGDSVILFDSQKAMPPHPSLVTDQQQKPKKTWLGTVAGAFQREPLTLQEIDLLMGRVPIEDPNEVRKQKMEAYKAKVQQNDSASSSKPGGVFAQLGDKMNERGDRINQLDKKFEDLNAASGDFLKAVKDYNERQARKKWWEF